jgi:shikimate kinase
LDGRGDGKLNFFLVGHRGVGKSTCLQLLKALYPGKFFDLDEEIVSRRGARVEEIFRTQGEETFRRIEGEVFEELLRESAAAASGEGAKNLWISVGGGFQGPFPVDGEVIWLRRESDRAGRIFLDRPALNPGQAPLQEWSERFQEREKRFQAIHSQILTLPEGEWLLSKTLKAFFDFWFSAEGVAGNCEAYDVTLLPGDFSPQERWQGKQIYRRARRLEVREDLLNGPECHAVKEKVEDARIYYSRRKKGSDHNEFGQWRDWDMDLGAPPKEYWSFSLHQGQFEKVPPGILKWAPEVKTFKELYLGHQWMAGDPQRRVFLPRSPEGRWRWYRRLFTAGSPLFFVRENQGSALDQPFWYETALLSSRGQGFAAVLGGAVDLSWTPSFHEEFFRAQGMPVVSVAVAEKEWDEALDVLVKLGLRAAAVTSPLKKKAFSRCTDFVTPEDRELGSLNTLFFQDEKIFGVNTDLIGLREIFGPALKRVVWGGGGLLPVLKKVFVDAEFVPAREGKVLNKDSVIIWASLRSDQVRCPHPLKHVKKVIDLNYNENSMGKELALLASCPYVSGAEFFKRQALHQQTFWSHFL